MGLRSRVQDAVRVLRKGADPRSVMAERALVLGIHTQLVLPPRDLGPLIEVSQENPTLAAAVNAIGDACASVPLQLKRRIKGGKDSEVVPPAKHDLAKLFCEHINAQDTPLTFNTMLYTSLPVTGENPIWVDLD